MSPSYRTTFAAAIDNNNLFIRAKQIDNWKLSNHHVTANVIEVTVLIDQ